MTYPPITYKLLQQKNVPEKQIQLIKDTFGELPVPLNDQSIEKVPLLFWTAPRYLLSIEHASDFDKFNKIELNKHYDGITTFEQFKKIMADEFIRLYNIP